ncbi:MAG: hypothetical protein ABI653_06845 [Bacteroidota bacterium]
MILFSEYTSPRLSYIIEILFPAGTICTNNKEDFIKYTGGKLNYSNEKITDREIWVKPHLLLFEKNISVQQTEIFQWHDLPAFFKTGGAIPFDFLAASFYLISRYEEYLSFSPDEYGRYPHTASIAFKNNFLNLPLIDLWLHEIFPQQNEKSFLFLPTFDIDIAFKYLYKPVAKNFAVAFKELITGNSQSLSMRSKVRSGKEKDPFDQYDFIENLTQNFSLQPIYFFLLADKNSRYDKNISPQKDGMKNLMKRIAVKNKTGIHPSWQSGDNKNLLKEEIETLQKFSGQKVEKSRQHYIRMTMPHTYRTVIENNITEDYSLGYGSINGFRASTSKSFFWYDLEKEEKTSLQVFPFCYMDANSIFEQKLNPAETETELAYYKNIISKSNGQMIGIWHNHFLTEEKEWLPWRKVFENFLESYR